MFNILVYGVPESTSTSFAQRIEDDMVVLQGLLKEFINVSPVISSLIRLGKITPGSHRPLKIIFGSKEDAAMVLTYFNDAKHHNVVFPPEFRIVKDKTLLQREQLRSCHSKIDSRERNGETGLHIKYIIGIPTVVSDILKTGIISRVSGSNHNRRIGERYQFLVLPDMLKSSFFRSF